MVDVSTNNLVDEIIHTNKDELDGALFDVLEALQFARRYIDGNVSYEKSKSAYTASNLCNSAMIELIAYRLGHKSSKSLRAKISKMDRN